MEYLLGIVIVLIAVAGVALREWGKSAAREAAAEDDLMGANKAIKEAEDADKIRRKAINDTIRGVVPDRLRKHYRD